MDESASGTFAKLLRAKLSEGSMRPDDSVLVQFAGSFDEQVCASAGLSNCHFANIAPNSASTGDTVAERFDAHRMPQADGSYDHVVAHSGLHHCSRPHEALHEMYRLARKSVTFVENQDSLLMRAATAAGLVYAYELPAVVGANYESGGVDGTAVPNYVYRWTRRDLMKTVAAYDPAFHVPIEFHTEWNIGVSRASTVGLRRKLRLRSDTQAEILLLRAQRILNAVAASQGNIFAATIRKDLRLLRRWMEAPDRMAQPVS